MSQGSAAGTVASILPGYYLVGRHKECQIRPKSKSVSRRHCLLLRNEDGFGALDLRSTRGTFVNGEQIEPHQWRVLNHGDEIRFGKVSFTVSIDLPVATVSSEALTPESSASSQPPESWQNVDVAAFLEEEDDAEYAEKYGEPAANSDSGDIEAELEADVLSETPAKSTGDTMVGDLPSESVADSPADEKEVDKRVEVDSKPKAAPPRRKIDPKQYKKASKRSLSLPSLNIPEGSGLKLVGALALVLLIGAFFVYQVYQFTSPTQIEVRDDLD
ncbi:MAG: FHA domain-containing protein [Planctomycetota bacterium]